MHRLWKKTPHCLLSCMIIANSGSLSAGTMGAVESDLTTWVGTLSLGPAWAQGGETQTFYLQPNTQKTFTSNKPTSTIFDGEIFLGLQSAFRDNLEAQLGFAVAATSQATLSGHIWDDADPNFDNFTYSYNVQHTHVALKGKVLATPNERLKLKPYVSGSVGVGFNRASNYGSVALIYPAIVAPNFAAYTTTTFTYTVGAGIEKRVSQHVQAGLGYEFADWGSSKLARSAYQTLNSGLSISHLYTNALMFNLTYLA